MFLGISKANCDEIEVVRFLFPLEMLIYDHTMHLYNRSAKFGLQEEGLHGDPIFPPWHIAHPARRTFDFRNPAWHGFTIFLIRRAELSFQRPFILIFENLHRCNY